jgi:hypothetical protein
MPLIISMSMNIIDWPIMRRWGWQRPGKIGTRLEDKIDGTDCGQRARPSVSSFLSRYVGTTYPNSLVPGYLYCPRPLVGHIC